MNFNTWAQGCYASTGSNGVAVLVTARELSQHPPHSQSLAGPATTTSLPGLALVLQLPNVLQGFEAPYQGKTGGALTCSASTLGWMLLLYTGQVFLPQSAKARAEQRVEAQLLANRAQSSFGKTPFWLQIRLSCSSTRPPASGLCPAAVMLSSKPTMEVIVRKCRCISKDLMAIPGPGHLWS
jgi:hypothetical protein